LLLKKVPKATWSRELFGGKKKFKKIHHTFGGKKVMKLPRILDNLGRFLGTFFF